MKTPSPRRILLTQHGLCRRNEHTAAQTGSCSSAGSVRCTARRPPRSTFRSDTKGPVLRRKERAEREAFATRTKWSQNQPPTPSLCAAATLHYGVHCGSCGLVPTITLLLLHTLPYLTGQVDFCWASRKEKGERGRRGRVNVGGDLLIIVFKRLLKVVLPGQHTALCKICRVQSLLTYLSLPVLTRRKRMTLI